MIKSDLMSITAVQYGNREEAETSKEAESWRVGNDDLLSQVHALSQSEDLSASSILGSRPWSLLVPQTLIISYF